MLACFLLTWRLFYYLSFPLRHVAFLLLVLVVAGRLVVLAVVLVVVLPVALVPDYTLPFVPHIAPVLMVAPDLLGSILYLNNEPPPPPVRQVICLVYSRQSTPSFLRR
jgi:hypothetical protein